MSGTLGARTLTTKILLSLAAVGFTGAVAGVGTFATFTGTASESHTLATGTVSIALPAAGATNRLATGATGLVPGDTIQRVVDVANDGTQDLAGITLTTSASTSSLLDTDATNGLQILVEKCSVAWVETGPPYTYTCAGTTTTVLAQRAVVMSAQTLSNMSSLTAGATDRLRVTITLPSSAPNTMQGLSSTLDYTFTATQRAATNK